MIMVALPDEPLATRVPTLDDLKAVLRIAEHRLSSAQSRRTTGGEVSKRVPRFTRAELEALLDVATAASAAGPEYETYDTKLSLDGAKAADRWWDALQGAMGKVADRLNRFEDR